MGLVFALVLPVAAGFSAASWLRGSTLSRAECLLDLCLGIGLGLGATAVGWFVWLLVAGPPGWGFLITEAAACAVAAVALAVVRRRWSAGSPVPRPTPPSDRHRLRSVLAVALSLVVTLSLLAFVVCWLGDPHGHWDAVAIWNLRARFLFLGSNHWHDAFALPSHGFHTDYPLLVSGSVARTWTYVGWDTPLAPAVIALLFTLGTAGVLAGLVAVWRGPAWGLLSAITLLGTAVFIRLGLGQIADVPLSFFILSAVGLLCLSDRANSGSRGCLVLAGMMAGLAAWTKNEGLLFLACLVPAWLLVRGWARGWKNAIGELPLLLLGLLPIALLLAYFKANLAGSNDLVGGQPTEAALARLGDSARYRTIAVAFVFEVLRVGPAAVVVLAIVFYLLGRVPREARTPAALPLLVAALLLLGYAAIYLLTSPDLRWHLHSSLHRLLMQVWPLVLFGYFLILATPAEAAMRSAAAKAARTAVSRPAL